MEAAYDVPIRSGSTLRLFDERRTTLGDGVFPVVATLTWNSLPAADRTGLVDVPGLSTTAKNAAVPRITGHDYASCITADGDIVLCRVRRQHFFATVLLQSLHV